MEDSLKNARFIHLVIIGICATVIVFAISPRQSQAYESAILELNMLKALDLGKLREYVQEGIAEDESEEFKKAVEKFINQTQISVSDSVKLDAVSTLPHIFKYPPLDSPLVEVEKYFDSDHLIFVFKPDIGELEEQLKQVVASVRIERKDAKSLVLTKIGLNNEQTRLEELQKDLDSFHGKIDSGVPSTATFEVEIKTDIGYSTRLQTMTGHLFPLKKRNFKGWFRAQKEYQFLIGQSAGNSDGIVFPKLHAVWNEVLTSTPDAALVVLEEKKKSGRRQVSFLGLNVEEDIAIIAGPAAILMTTLYLFVHLKHISLFLKSNEYDLRSFSWIALFPDKLSQALTYSSLIALPFVADAMLVIRSWTSTRLIGWIAVALTITSLTYGTLLLLQIARLRHAIK